MAVGAEFDTSPRTSASPRLASWTSRSLRGRTAEEQGSESSRTAAVAQCAPLLPVGRDDRYRTRQACPTREGSRSLPTAHRTAPALHAPRVQTWRSQSESAPGECHS